MAEKMVAMYRNKRVDELTRDELIVAYQAACEQLDSMRRWQREHAAMEQLFSDTRKALHG